MAAFKVQTRTVIYTVSIVLAILVYVITVQHNPIFEIAALKLTRYFGLIAFGLVFTSLLGVPLFAAFPNTPGKALYNKAYKALGASALFFAFLHAYYAFFKVLHGFPGLPFLSGRYWYAIIFSTIALSILALMVCSSFNFVIKKTGRYGRWLSTLVYVGAFLIPTHVLLIGNHFTSGTSLIGQVFVFLWLLLLLLEEIRLHQYITKKYPRVDSTLLAIMCIAFFVTIFYVVLLTDTFITHHHV